MLYYEIKNGLAVGAWLQLKKPATEGVWKRIVGEYIPAVGNKSYLSMYASIEVSNGPCKSAKSFSLVYKPDTMSPNVK